MELADNYQQICQEWLSKNLTAEAIDAEISKKYQDADLKERLWAVYKKAKADRTHQKGFLWTGIGAIMCFLSCVITMCNPFPDMVGLFLYGLTTAGLVVIMIGLYLVFEP